jgi:hypothetical protein
MGLPLQDIKFCISDNGRESILHMMQGCVFPTMHAMKKVDPHRIQMLAINVV